MSGTEPSSAPTSSAPSPSPSQARTAVLPPLWRATLLIEVHQPPPPLKTVMEVDLVCDETGTPQSVTLHTRSGVPPNLATTGYWVMTAAGRIDLLSQHTSPSRGA